MVATSFSDKFGRRLYSKSSVEPRNMPRINDTNSKAKVAPSSGALEAKNKSRIIDLWTVLHTGLLEKWIHSTPTQGGLTRKSRIARKFYSAYKRFKLKVAGKDINSILNAEPHRAQRKYSGCHILFLVWEDCNTGYALKEVEGLKKELEERWGFWGDVYKIPFVDERSAQQEVVENAVEEFVEHWDSNSKLLLVHYGGYGVLNKSGDYVLHQPNNGKLYEVKFKPIRERLQECKADVGIFLDSCYSEPMARSTQPHTVEALSAYGEANTTAGASPESLTNGILRVLRDQEESLSMNELSEELGKLVHPSLGNKPVYHPLALSIWESIQLRRGIGGQERYPKAKSLFNKEVTE